MPDDSLKPLRAGVTGQLEQELEKALRERPGLVATALQSLVDAHFPSTVGPDVLLASGMDPELAKESSGSAEPGPSRARSSTWPGAVLEAWDR